MPDSKTLQQILDTNKERMTAIDYLSNLTDTQLRDFIDELAEFKQERNLVDEELNDEHLIKRISIHTKNTAMVIPIGFGMGRTHFVRIELCNNDIIEAQIIAINKIDIFEMAQ